MLSTTTKSCMRTSLSAFWLKLPTVWVMPSWMAPFRADDVVYRGKREKDNKHWNKQIIYAMTAAVSLTILGCLVRGVSKLFLEYKHHTCRRTHRVFTFQLCCSVLWVSTNWCRWPPSCSNLFIGGLSCGGLNAPVSNGLLHTLSWRARHLRRGTERKNIQTQLNTA